MTESRDDARAINTGVARDYDALVYEPQVNESLDLANVFGLAALYGCGGASRDLDVLDLGCGTGVQLARIGAETRGKLIGVDISREACKRAEARCAAYGVRARVHCTDFLDLAVESIGTFDLIYSIGVIFVAPPSIRDRLLDLIGKCLRPRGVAVIGYYAGSFPLMRAGLYRLLRENADRNESREESAKRARRLIEGLAAGLPAAGPRREVLAQMLQHVQAQPDPIFFHEALGPAWDVLSTQGIASTLGARGAAFLNYLSATPFGALRSSIDRAGAADQFDFASGGGYRYAVFGKPPASGGADLHAPNICWRTSLRRVVDTATYSDPASNTNVRIARSDTQAALDELAAGALSWTDLLKGAQARPQSRTNAALFGAEFDQDMLALWNARLITPVWAPAPCT